MKLFRPKQLIIGLLLLAGAVLAYALEPRFRMADVEPKVNLENLVPEVFGSWKVDKSVVPLAPDPTLLESMRVVYDQTLQRTYVDSSGRRIMLSIAYSSIPSAIVDLHTPDLCYPSQGFRIDKSASGTIAMTTGLFPVKRLVARKLNRIEPLTYWILTGDKVTLEKAQWRMTQLGFGLSGKIADGLLFRVSSIGANSEIEYALQDEFVNSLLGSLDEGRRARLVGRPG